MGQRINIDVDVKKGRRTSRKLTNITKILAKINQSRSTLAGYILLCYMTGEIPVS